VSIFREILTKYWGYSNFRPLQEDIIQSLYNGYDTLGLMPTGGGKSITFQVPALAMDGICLVITPLIALMKDQVDNLKRRGIKALAIYSGLSKEEINIILDNCVFGDYKFLYLSPERLKTEMFQARLKNMKISFIAVDESHCISQWGYDFRPSYLEIAKIREQLPNVPILALTATATLDVVDDIQDKLLFRKKNVFSKSFERKNVVYLIRETEDKLKYILKILENIKGTGIIYVRNRRKTKEIAEFLQKNNISADYYHAGLKAEIKDKKQNDWKNGICRVIVSTNAFGMGIDKDNVRVVIHIDLTDSLEAYFQEAGRAGRDEKQAFAILLYHKSDKTKIEQRIEKSFPPIEEAKKIYSALGNYFQLPVGAGKGMSYDFDIGDFCTRYKLEIMRTFSSLKLLEMEGYIELTEDIENPSKLHFLVNRDDLYKFQVANASYDVFIKFLLRSYTGLFTDFVTINEEQIAKKTNLKIDVIKDLLQKLNNAKIVRYIPRKHTPMLIYTEERLDEKSVLISRENYEIRKNRFVDKVNAVFNYATSHTKCRSQLLLEYFGEKTSYRCGNCDVCTQRNELNMSKYEFDVIVDELKLKLTKNSFEFDQVVDWFHDKEEKAIKVIRWLVDNEKILKEGNLLRWNKK
jgi:ATP-dependent DNA helicase RecQ